MERKGWTFQRNREEENQTGHEMKISGKAGREQDKKQNRERNNK